jgi:hypothetical protein
MKLPAPSSQRETAPEGNHVAICRQFIDLGTQKTVYNDEAKHQRKVLLGWELANETDSEGQPFITYRRYTFSMHEAAIFRKHLETWRGKKFTAEDFGPDGFDVRNLIGVPCMVQVSHHNGYANVDSVGSLPKGMPKPEPETPAVYLALEPGEFDSGAFSQLGEKLQETIRQSPEFQKLKSSQSTAEYLGGVEESEDDVHSPF